MWRPLTLIAGPIVLIGLCYAVAGPGGPTGGELRQSQVRQARHRSVVRGMDLENQCRLIADTLDQKLSPQWQFVIRPPYILGGDVAPEVLEQLYRTTIQPTARALAVCYFDEPPTQPVTILTASSDESYRACSRCLENHSREEYAGIYSRETRRIVLNLSSGEGTLAHELTHALAHADFADLPEWFDEGLASLHEESEFSQDGLELLGLDNWRGKFLAEALDRDCLPPLERLLLDDFGDSDQPQVEYAQARFLCLYLQEKRLLSHYYRKCRATHDLDPTGNFALCDLFGCDDVSAIDREFRAWLRQRR